jgi:hypothetical protein
MNDRDRGPLAHEPITLVSKLPAYAARPVDGARTPLRLSGWSSATSPNDTRSEERRIVPTIHVSFDTGPGGLVGDGAGELLAVTAPLGDPAAVDAGLVTDLEVVGDVLSVVPRLIEQLTARPAGVA